tara:strand:+ start:12180 stop:12767 length:588 start_codon:yes stop_codon:yes gene_type:complete
MKTVMKKISELIPAEYNPRTLSKKQFEDLRASFKRFGMVEPIIVNKNAERQNIVVGGHQRLRVAESLEMEKVPVVYVDLTLDKEKELNIRLNKSGGKFDMEALANYFDETDLLEWGFEEVEFFSKEDTPDYSALDDEDFSSELDDMESDVRRALQIPFEAEDYEKAKDLYKSLTDKDIYVGGMILDMLHKENSKL